MPAAASRPFPRPSVRSPLLAIVVAVATLLAACQPAPVASTAPTAAPPSATAAPVQTPGNPAPSATAAAGTGTLAERLRNALSGEDILADLGRLQAIADANNGNRSAGSAGYEASAAFVAEQLRAAGYEVELQPVEIPFFSQDAPTVLLIGGDPAGFEDLRDYKAMLFSASGDVTAKVVAPGFDPTAGPGFRGGLGCNPADFADVPFGSIVLVQPANCRRHDVVVNAQNAGAVAVITSYADWPRDAVLRPTLIEPLDIRVPAIGTTKDVGLALAAAATSGTDVQVRTSTTAERRTASNVIGETPGGDAGHVVMLGGHLDSVIDGPGINDNGSGTMAVLEIARELAAISGAGAPPPWKVRVAFWTAEEIGLVGSSAYVSELGAGAANLAAYLNFDMVGSPNGVRHVYDGAGTQSAAASGQITALFGQAFDAEGLPWQTTGIGASSDHFPFDLAGVPVGGLFSGANEHKDATQASLFGGTAEVPTDPCYHLACDGPDNIDPALLLQLARAAAWVTGTLASGEVTLGGT